MWDFDFLNKYLLDVCKEHNSLYRDERKNMKLFFKGSQFGVPVTQKITV